VAKRVVFTDQARANANGAWGYASELRTMFLRSRKFPEVPEVPRDIAGTHSADSHSEVNGPFYSRALRRIFSKTKNVEFTRLGGQMIGDRFVESAIVYRIR
jgi:hypothetical protein